MEKDFEKKYHELEEDHWWFLGRREIITNLIKNKNKRLAILDVGCSGGDLLLELKKQGFNDLTGIDISKSAINLCKKKGLKRCYLMDASNIKLNKKFDIIVASDILEHIKDDASVVRSFARISKSRGKIICFVPAFKILWSNHDVLNKHFRRYTKKDLTKLFEENKFKIERASYWNFLLFFPILFFRFIQKNIIRHSNLESLNKTPKKINYLLTKILSVENYFLKYFNYPFGVSVFAIASKK